MCSKTVTTPKQHTVDHVVYLWAQGFSCTLPGVVIVHAITVNVQAGLLVLCVQPLAYMIRITCNPCMFLLCVQYQLPYSHTLEHYTTSCPNVVQYLMPN